MVVIRTDQMNKGICSKDMLEGFILKIVEIKLIAPKIDEIPAKWREKIVRSTEIPLWKIWVDKGG